MWELDGLVLFADDTVICLVSGNFIVVCLVGMHSAVKEDAIRSVESKNDSVLQGRKIKVELAMRRAPLDTRHPKGKRKGQFYNQD